MQSLLYCSFFRLSHFERCSLSHGLPTIRVTYRVNILFRHTLRYVAFWYISRRSSYSGSPFASVRPPNPQTTTVESNVSKPLLCLLINPSVRCNTTNHDGPPPIPTSIMPCLAFILSPNSPFYHHCFPSLQCRWKWICANDLPKGARTQNIIINATATATAISCMIKVPSNQCTYHAGTAVFRSTRTASPTIEFYVVHTSFYVYIVSTIYTGAPILYAKHTINATAITTHPPLFGQLVCCSIFFVVDPLDVVTV